MSAAPPRFPAPAPVYDPRNEAEFRRALAAYLHGVEGLAGVIGQPGADGADGADGANGADGADAIVGVSDGTYGDDTHVAAITVSGGQITAITEEAITSSGGSDSGGYGGEHAGTTDYEAWYPAGMAPGDAIAGFSSSVGHLRAVPFIAPARGGTLDAIAVEVNVAVASKNIRIGLYSSKGVNNIYPDTLLVDSGDISTGTTGRKIHTLSQALTAGRVYWLAVSSDASVTIQGSSTGGYNPLLGFHSTVPLTLRRYLDTTFTHGALPATFPAGVTGTTGTGPVLLYRFSA